MFTKSVHLYELLYSSKDYEGEANALTRIIRDVCPTASTLLDVACGPHEHVRFLTKDFSVDGLDLNTDLLELAKPKNPIGTYTQGDMRAFGLDQKYDAVACLFSSIGYVANVEELNATVACFAAHTKPGGAVIVEPWFTPERWTAGHVTMRTAQNEHMSIARSNITVQKGNKSPIRFHYMVATPDGVDTFTEDHDMTLFTPDEMRSAFSKAGLNLRDMEGWPCDRGIYVGEVPQSA
jgi:trans-aconitate methyltransferase